MTRWHLSRWQMTWWRHQMETFSALLAICAGNSPVPGEFPAQRPVTRSFDAFFDLRLNQRLSTQSWGWWFETLPRPSWRHCNEILWNLTILGVLIQAGHYSYISAVFRRGQYWLLGYCRCLRLFVWLCSCVCTCDNSELVRAITHHLLKLGLPNFGQKCETPWLRSLYFRTVRNVSWC